MSRENRFGSEVQGEVPGGFAAAGAATAAGEAAAAPSTAGVSGVSGAALAVELDGFGFAYPLLSDAAAGKGAGERASASRSATQALGGRQVLDNCTWQLPDGAFCLLTGATGSGKTTLLRSLKPEIAPVGQRSGRILVYGRELRHLEGAESAALVGYVAQNPATQIVCDTVWHELAFGLENLGCPVPQMRRRVAEVAGFFGMEHWMDRATASLSGGQQQLLNLAGVLALRPRLLLLDEPTAQLDPVAQKNFLHSLFRVNRELGITVLVATHDPQALADYATDCVALQAGKLVPGDVAAYRAAARERASVPVASVSLSPASASAQGEHPAELAVTVHDAFFRYERKSPWVLRSCDLDLAPGEIRALVGGNGSGKSTLLRLAAGVAKPQRGRVRNPFQDCQVLLPQDPRTLFVCDSVAQELAEWQQFMGYGAERIAQVIQQFGLTGLEERHPYDLSGGQQQLLALAKLLLTDPRLLLLDEPTKGLDASAKMVVARALRAVRADGCTVLLATHDLAFSACVADSVSMLFDGAVTCTEPTAPFFADNLFYRPPRDAFVRLWEAEAKRPAKANAMAGEAAAPASVFIQEAAE